jgi:hypothetical protein
MFDSMTDNERRLLALEVDRAIRQGKTEASYGRFGLYWCKESVNYRYPKG